CFAFSFRSEVTGPHECPTGKMVHLRGCQRHSSLAGAGVQTRHKPSLVPQICQLTTFSYPVWRVMIQMAGDHATTINQLDPKSTHSRLQIPVLWPLFRPGASGIGNIPPVEGG